MYSSVCAPHSQAELRFRVSFSSILFESPVALCHCARIYSFIGTKKLIALEWHSVRDSCT